MDKKETNATPAQGAAQTASSGQQGKDPVHQNWWYESPEKGSPSGSPTGASSPGLGGAFLQKAPIKPVDSNQNMFKEFDEFNY
ncbi:Hypothetical predicted protein [Mytilus galloprovincialis]|uniref:Uncharacterized protein n=2 Tax=Mytilus galloprovincialis TaxID=29158 RepID=A0A8B6EZS6_MYTGA|nr:Hypothetical predicted protein [Mytilus galloprovincialis]